MLFVAGFCCCSCLIFSEKGKKNGSRVLCVRLLNQGKFISAPLYVTVFSILFVKPVMEICILFTDKCYCEGVA